MEIDWNRDLFDQLDWHWSNQLRLRLDGLTDDEYFWEPVPGWSVRRRGEGRAKEVGSGDYILDWDFPEPVPSPVTTIAWRLAHIITGVFGTRNAAHFGGPPIKHKTFPYAGSANEALAQLDSGYARWSEGVRGLGEAGLARTCGPAEGAFADFPLSTLILHINREVIHHGAEISLLRDLYRARASL